MYLFKLPAMKILSYCTSLHICIYVAQVWLEHKPFQREACMKCKIVNSSFLNSHLYSFCSSVNWGRSKTVYYLISGFWSCFSKYRTIWLKVQDNCFLPPRWNMQLGIQIIFFSSFMASSKGVAEDFHNMCVTSYIHLSLPCSQHSFLS